ncbi:MAG: response regulator [Ignavibacteriaceae bacterium]|jgi:response regulator RpfG family c-di-GMP phosphodiesterase|nr:response regulator [Ignavibacteriaceae bacterium]
MNNRILLVDDDENILSSYKRTLRIKFNVSTSSDPVEALKLFTKPETFAVVLSDFKMPRIDGNTFLSEVKKYSPDTVRIMLTGYADTNTAITAVNKGSIFRLLTKPCPNDVLIDALSDALSQYALITAEKELLQKTLKGSIKLLIDILSVFNPKAFSQASRLTNLTKNIAYRFGLNNTWEIETMVLLSKIGCVAIPSDILEKRLNGETLTPEEENLYQSHPQIGKSLLANIPRLENISNIISYQLMPFNAHSKTQGKIQADEIPIEARILKVLDDYDFYLRTGLDEKAALQKMKEKSGEYDTNILVALDAEIAGIYSGLRIVTINIEDIEAGMVIAEAIKDKVGHTLISKGSEISLVLKARLGSYMIMNNVEKKVKIFRAWNG